MILKSLLLLITPGFGYDPPEPRKLDAENSAPARSKKMHSVHLYLNVHNFVNDKYFRLEFNIPNAKELTYLKLNSISLKLFI